MISLSSVAPHSAQYFCFRPLCVHPAAVTYVHSAGLCPNAEIFSVAIVA
ncbi:MAG: hypothetical protein PUK79_00435 [Clostridiales bacterium]|nr:hypothetical protein [Clostridiales bacterium]